MRQLVVQIVDIRNPAYRMTPGQKWDVAVQNVLRQAAWYNPRSAIQAAVDLANRAGIAARATAYERREALQSTMIGTGWHVDRKNKVTRLSDLISLRDVAVSEEADRACVRFKLVALLESGQEYVSEETLEWLDVDGDVVSGDRHLDINVQPLVEASRALDAYMTDVSESLYWRLEIILAEMRLEAAVDAKCRGEQTVPLWMAGPELTAQLVEESIIKNYGGDYLSVGDVPGVRTVLQHHLNEEGLIAGSTFVVLCGSEVRAAVVTETNSEYKRPVWVTASTVRGALVEYERTKL